MKWRSILSLGKLGPREKAAIVLWVFAIAAAGYAQAVYRPRARMLREAAQQLTALEGERHSLLAQRPDLEQRQEAITTLKTTVTARYGELVQAERDLLDAQDVDELLQLLVKDRARFELALNTVRPVTEQEPSATERAGAEEPAGLYEQFRVQVDVYATYQGLVDYVAFLETMRPYQQVEGVKIKVEGKEVSRQHAVVTVGVLLGDTLEAREARHKDVFALLDQVAAKEAKDPFLTRDRPKELVQAVGLTLTGVFSEDGRQVAAMINNEIYRVGQVVDGKRLVAIEPNRVLLEQGNRMFVLAPSTAQEEGAP